MPRRSYDPTECGGIALVENLFRSQLEWDWREQPPPDVGVDAQVEIVVEGRLSGKLLGIQVKAGRSYLDEKVDTGFVYRGNKEHLDYWSDHSLPVIIVLCDLEHGTAYWQHVTKERVETTGKAWKIIVPFDQVLNKSAATPLRRIAHRECPITRFAVPFPRNPRFVGRDGDLLQLHEMLRGDKPVGIVGLTGIGGIGKTQLAVEYAYRHQADHEGGVFWVNAVGDLVEGLARCAHAAGFGESGADLSDLNVRRVLTHDLYRWLQENPHSLLILDNIAGPARVNEPLWGDLVLLTLPCRILFTTRSQALDTKTFASWEVKVLPRDASLELLLGDRRAGAKREAVEWAAADEICRMLGDLPLAVGQARVYLKKWWRVRISDYRDRLGHEGLMATDDATPLRDHDLATRHAVGLRLALQGSIGYLDPNGDALRVLRILAEFDATDNVPRAWVASVAEFSRDRGSAQPDQLSVAVDELRAVSLVEEVSGDRLRVHPVVRHFARSLTPPEQRAAWQEKMTATFGMALLDVVHLTERANKEGAYPVIEDLIAGYYFGIAQAEPGQFVRLLQTVLAATGHGSPSATVSHPEKGVPGPPEFDVFLCYNSSDWAAVIEIADALERRGIRTWLDIRELLPGQRWLKALEEQIERMSAAAVFIGPTGIGPWQEIEVDAILRVMDKRGCPVVPVLLPTAPDSSRLPIFLAGIQWVDFRIVHPDPIERLAWGITGHSADVERP